MDYGALDFKEFDILVVLVLWGLGAWTMFTEE